MSGEIPAAVPNMNGNGNKKFIGTNCLSLILKVDKEKIALRDFVVGEKSTHLILGYTVRRSE
jgi:hypothetical protein